MVRLAALEAEKLKREQAEIAARETATRKQAEVQRAAELAAARESERQQQEKARLASLEAEKLKREQDETAAREAASRKQVDDQKAAELAQRTASVANAQALPPPQPDDLVGESLVRALQQELTRVGCDPGSTDGKWGPQAREALARFVALSKAKVSTDEATEAALFAVRGKSLRVCPLKCDDDQQVSGGTCVRKAVLPQSPKRKEQKVTADKDPPKPADSSADANCKAWRNCSQSNIGRGTSSELFNSTGRCGARPVAC